MPIYGYALTSPQLFNTLFMVLQRQLRCLLPGNVIRSLFHLHGASRHAPWFLFGWGSGGLVLRKLTVIICSRLFKFAAYTCLLHRSHTEREGKTSWWRQQQQRVSVRTQQKHTSLAAEICLLQVFVMLYRSHAQRGGEKQLVATTKAHLNPRTCHTRHH